MHRHRIRSLYDPLLGFGWWFGGNFAKGTGGWVNGYRQFVIDCGFNNWPAEIKGYTTDI